MKLSVYAYEKTLCIAELGGGCSNPDCGESDHDLLQFDHIHGDGFVHRNQASSHRGSHQGYLKKLRVSGRLAEVLQLLCVKCHKRKTKRAGEYVKRDVTGVSQSVLPLFDWVDRAA